MPTPTHASSDADPGAQSAKLHARAHFIVIKFWRGVVWAGSFFCSHCILSCRYLRPTQDLEGEQKLHVSPKEKDPREAVRPEASPPSHSLVCSRQSPAWGRGGVGAAELAGEAQPRARPRSALAASRPRPEVP